MRRVNDKTEDQSFLDIALSQEVLPRAIRVALIVGTILAIINHGDKMIPVTLTGFEFAKVILTYFVPFSVSTWSSVGAIRGRRERGA
jgi:hypothetical protein